MGVVRSSTDINSTGVRASWDNIWGSNFNGSLTTRNIDVDENSQWRFAPGQQLAPALIYIQTGKVFKVNG